MILKKKKINDSEVLKFGFLGGIAQATYVFLVIVFMTVVDKAAPPQPNIATGFLVLLLLVFSVAVSGVLVFGYPAYLAFQKRFNEALMTAAITLATLAIIGILGYMIISF